MFAGALEVDGESANVKNVDGEIVLYLVVLYGKVVYVEVLLCWGVDFLVMDELFGMSLYDACASGYVDVARALCDVAWDVGMFVMLLKKVDED